MKIAIVSAGVLPIPAIKGGAVETLVEYFLSENKKNGSYDITVYSINDDNIGEKDLNRYKNVIFKFINVKQDNKFSTLYKKIMRKIFNIHIDDNYIKGACHDLQSKNFDYILVENRSQYVIPISKATNSKILLHLHNDYLNNETINGKHILDKCDKILTVSEYIKSRVNTVYKQDKTYVWANCVDIQHFEKNTDENNRKLWRQKYNIKDDEVVVLFTGRLVEEKGIKELLLAATKLDETLKFKVCIVGASWYSNGNINEFIEELKKISEPIKDKVLFTGYIPFKEMCLIYNMADIGVIPSIWDDPAPLVVMESMISGLPIIVTDSGGIPEYRSFEGSIEIKRDKYLIDNLASSIEKLIIDKDLRLKMGIESKKHARQFSTIKYYEDFGKIINENK